MSTKAERREKKRLRRELLQIRRAGARWNYPGGPPKRRARRVWARFGLYFQGKFIVEKCRWVEV